MLSPYPCFISFLYPDLYVLGDDAYLLKSVLQCMVMAFSGHTHLLL